VSTLARRPLAEWPPDLPLVSEWVNDPTQAPAMLIADRANLMGAGVDRLREYRAGVVDDEQRPTRCSVDRLGTEAPSVRRCSRHPEGSVTDCELHDNVVALAHAMQDDRTERRFIELDRRIGSIDPELRLNASHDMILTIILTYEQRNEVNDARLQDWNQRGMAGGSR
jgi:hypothetical protein